MGNIFNFKKLNQQGSITLMFVIVFIFFLVIGVIAVDVGMAVVEKAKITTAADAAAIAGANEFLEEHSSDEDTRKAVEKKAKKFFYKNYFSGLDDFNWDGDLDALVTSASALGIVLDFAPEDISLTEQSITVRPNRVSSSYFAKLFKVDKINTKGYARAGVLAKSGTNDAPPLWVPGVEGGYKVGDVLNLVVKQNHKTDDDIISKHPHDETKNSLINNLFKDIVDEDFIIQILDSEVLEDPYPYLFDEIYSKLNKNTKDSIEDIYNGIHEGDYEDLEEGIIKEFNNGNYSNFESVLETLVEAENFYVPGNFPNLKQELIDAEKLALISSSLSITDSAIYSYLGRDDLESYEREVLDDYLEENNELLYLLLKDSLTTFETQKLNYLIIMHYYPVHLGQYDVEGVGGREITIEGASGNWGFLGHEDENIRGGGANLLNHYFEEGFSTSIGQKHFTKTGRVASIDNHLKEYAEKSKEDPDFKIVIPTAKYIDDGKKVEVTGFLTFSNFEYQKEGNNWVLRAEVVANSSTEGSFMEGAPDNETRTSMLTR